jgi:hypothetical protein
MSSIPTTAPLAQPHMNGGMPPKTYRIRLVPHLETSRSLAFDPVVREILPIVVPTGASPSVAAASVTAVGPNVNGRLPALILKIGRFTEKVSQPGVPATPGVTGNGGGPLGTASGSGNGAGPASVPAPGPIGTGPITIAGGGGDVTSGKVGFKSKVVSRAHAEIWCQAGGKVGQALLEGRHADESSSSYEIRPVAPGHS